MNDNKNLQIEDWLNAYDNFEKLANFETIHGWLLIDMRTFKYVVLNECSKWINLFKEHLLNHVLTRLNVSEDEIFKRPRPTFT